jgi:flagellar export protein FliJ
VKRFKFSLADLLELRAFRERQAETVLSQKAGQVRLAEMELERVAQEEARTRSGRFSGSRSILDFINDERYLQRLSQEGKRGAKELAKREVERDEALGAFHIASRDKKALESLSDGERDAWRLAANRQETLEIDDIVTGRRARSAVADGRSAVAGGNSAHGAGRRT